jgi:hypothetical protein
MANFADMSLYLGTDIRTVNNVATNMIFHGRKKKNKQITPSLPPTAYYHHLKKLNRN